MIKEMMDRVVMDVQTYERLREAGFEEKQATVIAVLIPD